MMKKIVRSTKNFKFFALGFSFLMVPLVADAQDVASVKTPSSCAHVQIAGEAILCLENGVGAFSNLERAAAVSSRIERVADNLNFDTNKIIEQHHEANIEIQAGETVLISLSLADAVSNRFSSLDDFALQTLNRIRTAVEKDRQLKSPRQILFGAGYSAIATLVLIVLLFSFSHYYPKLYGFIRDAKRTRIRSLKIQTIEVLSAERMVEVLIWLAEVSRFLLTLLILYIYIPWVLSFFPWTANLAPKLFSYIIDPLKEVFAVILGYIPNLFFILAIGIATRFILRLVRFFFTELGRDNIRFRGFYTDWAEPTYKLVRFLILAFALVMAFPYLPGSKSPAFQGISVFLGVLVSFGSSSAISNMVAGVVLTYMRPFSIGDRVKISDTVGDVTEKTLLITRIRTIKNVDVTIPNSMVLGSHIVNYSSSANSTGLTLNTSVTIGYDAPWRQVHSLLLDAAARTPHLLKTPAPYVLQTSLDDFYVAYEINAVTDQPNRMARIYSDLHANIQDSFNEAGVEIMSPHYGALRDGNEVTIPPESRASTYRSPRFGIELKESKD